MEYLRAARHLDFAPEVIAIPRAGAGHDGGDHPDYPSASHLRGLIHAGKLPMDNPAALGYNERGVLSRLRGLELADFAALPDCGEGLAARLYRSVRQATALEELYALAKTKRYAHARIRRAVVWACLGLRLEDRPERPPYLRVLAANGRGIRVLRELERPTARHHQARRRPRHPPAGAGGAVHRLFQPVPETPLPCGAEWSTSPVIRTGEGERA